MAVEPDHRGQGSGVAWSSSSSTTASQTAPTPCLGSRKIYRRPPGRSTNISATRFTARTRSCFLTASPTGKGPTGAGASFGKTFS